MYLVIYVCVKRMFPYKFTDFVIVPVQPIVLQFMFGEKTIRGYINLLAAKTRVAPLEELIIPRLELLSCLLLVGLIRAVNNSLDDVGSAEIFCWSDSNFFMLDTSNAQTMEYLGRKSSCEN